MEKKIPALSGAIAGKTEAREEFYVPDKGQSSAGNFMQFYHKRLALFQKDVAKEEIYG